MEQVTREAIERVETSGIIFLDEIDKIAGREAGHGPDVSREGVQRDILPIVEGTTVNTRYGFVRTDHILFIAAGAFHVSKPSDMIPELQGRFPIRVELKSLTVEDFIRILKEPKNALSKQYVALMETEGIKLTIADDALAEVARFAAQVNESQRKHRRPPLAHHHGKTARRDLLRSSGPEEENHQDRRGVCPQTTRRDRERPGPEPVYLVIRIGSLLLAALLCGACGYIGEPLPPALNLPARVTDLTAVQRGGRILIQFTMPVLTTEAMPVRDTPQVDLRVGAVGAHFNESEWLDHSTRLPDQGKQTKYEASAAGFSGQTVVVAVRLLNDRDKTAGWSNFVQLSVAAPLARPAEVTARAVAQGVELSWTGDAPLFRVYRKDSPTTDFAPLGDAKASPYVDATAEFGKPYSYFVQGLQSTGKNASESDVSDTVAITPKDVFPPAVPANPRAILGATTVELSWDRNTESDLAGYRVFRAQGDGPFTLAADKLSAPSYSDRQVQRGTRYRYAISAFDLNGNESARSAPVDAVLP